MARKLERQVKFYEIVAYDDAGDDQADAAPLVRRIRPPLDPDADLLSHLADLRPEAPGEETSKTSALLVGRYGFTMHSRVYRPLSNQEAVGVFALSRVRLGEGGLPVVNRETGEYREVPLADEEGFAEESHIAFFPKNVVAVVSNGQGAPGPVRIEEYLQQRLDWDGVRIGVRALAPARRLEDLRRENSYTRAARVRLPATYQLITQDIRFYGDVTELAREHYGEGVEVDLTIKVPTRGDQDAADQLFEDFMAVAGSRQAKALELTYEDRETERGRAVNLLNDILAYTMPVTVERQSEDGAARVFSEWSTSRALHSAYGALRNEIDAATADG